MDITEIDGFDNLHEPEGILAESMEMARGMYGTKRTWFLINGSTVGILAALFAALPRGGRLLMARNSHRSVYHGVMLQDLETVYLYPDTDPETGIALGITARQVEEALEADPEIRAVMITSPTYECIVSDCAGIAGAVHKRGLPLLVDEAHGAHFPFHPRFPESALAAGADVVIQSVHKTLPALTQTALLHLQGNLIRSERLNRYLTILQSSSPSYLLMAGIDTCLGLIRDRGSALWEKMFSELDKFYKNAGNYRHIRVFQREEIQKDPGKLILLPPKTAMTGRHLYEVLRCRYHLQMEMAAESYTLGIVTCREKPEGFTRLHEALEELDSELQPAKETQKEKPTDLPPPVQTEKIAAAMEKEVYYADLDTAAGRECGCFVNLYPPGIPLVVPGEIISRELSEQLADYYSKGVRLQGLKGQKIAVIDNHTDNPSKRG